MRQSRHDQKHHIPPVLEQHAEETAFLWLLRDVAVSAPYHLLSDLAKLDTAVRRITCKADSRQQSAIIEVNGAD